VPRVGSPIVAYRPSASPASSLKSNRGGATTALDPGALQGFSCSSGVLSNALANSTFYMNITLMSNSLIKRILQQYIEVSLLAG